MQTKHFHFIGIGGSGMSALAAILAKQGHIVSGSDEHLSSYTDHLKKIGVRIFRGHDEKNISVETTQVVYSLAIARENPEMKFARKKKIPTVSYPEMVGELTRQFYTIGICGTHGKTTTTAMIAKILVDNNFDPTVIVGSKLDFLGNHNYRVGKKNKILVLEACEYQRAFLHYHPNAIIMHNIDADHFDAFKNFKEYAKAFSDFASKLPADGFFFGNLDDEDVHGVMQTMQKQRFPLHNTFTYSQQYEFSDFYLKDSAVVHKDARLGDLSLQIPGEHNRSNALAALSVGVILGIPAQNTFKSLSSYHGSARRFEMKGTIGKTIIIDDFGHHPVEIMATLQAAREKYPKKKICVIFQPHQYSRTKALLKEFGAAFQLADKVIVPNIFAARDSAKDRRSVSVADLVREINKNGTDAVDGKGIESTLATAKNIAKKFGIIITMGAGDVGTVADDLMRN